MVRVNKDYMLSGNKANAVTYGRSNRPNYIVIHETANTSAGADAGAHARLQHNGNSRQASWHYTVDDKGAYQSFAHSYACWHAGNANQQSIAIEICVNSGADYNKAVENAVELVQMIMKQEGIPASKVVQHNYWTGKNCPTNLRAGKGKWDWNAFKKAITGKAAAPSKPSKPAKPSNSQYYGKEVIGKKVRTKTKVNLYGSTDFDTPTKGSYPKGTYFTISDVKPSPGGTNRLKTKSGFYISANKKYVEKV